MNRMNSGETMSIWKDPNDELPAHKYGDRIVGVVQYRENHTMPILPHVVIFYTLDSGWYDTEQGCHDLLDCERWAYERDVIQQAMEIT